MTTQNNTHPFYYIEFLILIVTIAGALSCQPPDVPEGGWYTPVESRYLPGDKVVYSCHMGRTRTGRESRLCHTTGKWSGATPFCDKSTRVKSATATSDPSGQLNSFLDGRPETCFHTRNTTGQRLTVYLDPPAIVYRIRIYFPKGKVRLNIEICQRHGRTTGPSCMLIDVRNIENAQWLTLDCDDNEIVADYIKIQDTSDKNTVLAICEIEVFAKEDVWCRNSPDIFIPNGHLLVSRDKATLLCLEGYREGPNTRLVCEKNRFDGPILQCEEIICDSKVSNASLSNGEWQPTGGKFTTGTKRQLHCNSGFKITGQQDVVTCLRHGAWSSTTADCVKSENKPNYKLIAIGVSSVIVVLILFLLGLTLFLIIKKRSREVVVIYKPSGENTYMPASLNSGTTCTEAEYSSVYYEAIRRNSPVPPMPSRPSPYLQKCYSNRADELIAPHDAVFSSANTLPADIAFGTLKNSSLYDTAGGVWLLISANKQNTIAACTEAEYSSVYYEAIRHNSPVPPMPSRLSPYLQKCYSNPADKLIMPHNVVFSSANTLPADIAFGTLKNSSLYDTA
ncbi:hypothetical protein JTE90_008236 [Oedothorax gibbosus]|uniref:Sushi domain-containing protein n=1 Tax=Oedothorax gibbosus TaxID=931172 RepID=A0AAV6UNZ7_9ARAC|nr:hypothetical protein JTE90_008236 [Oedothorax gibbosus]